MILRTFSTRLMDVDFFSDGISVFSQTTKPRVGGTGSHLASSVQLHSASGFPRTRLVHLPHALRPNESEIMRSLGIYFLCFVLLLGRFCCVRVMRHQPCKRRILSDLDIWYDDNLLSTSQGALEIPKRASIFSSKFPPRAMAR
jgi:hypothetical protein